MSHVLEHIAAHAARSPEHAALVTDSPEDEREVISYAELRERWRALAQQLGEAGVSSGQRCGLLAPQGAGFIEHALGILACGACLVPVPGDSGAAALQVFARRARLHHLVRLDRGTQRAAVTSYAAVEAVDGQDDRAFRALDPAYLRFTSGTTDRRKGVILGHAAIEARLAAANRGLGVSPTDRILWLLPMAHHFVVSILLYLRYGATILLPRSSLAQKVLALCRRESATFLYASPYHYNLLAKDEGTTRLESVRLAISTAEGLREDVARRFDARFGLPLHQALGIIEVGLPVINLDASREWPLCLGRALPDYEVWLRGEDGQPAPDPSAPERSGEICIRGPGLFDAYMEPWTPARQILEPDGFRTGDQGWRDPEGNLYLAGRRSNRINMAGMKFFSEEVERVLDTHPELACSRVFAREHAHLGEIPVAEIVARRGASPPSAKALRDFCRQLLPAYKVPREFRVVASLPRTPTGKLERAPELSGER